MKPLRHASSSRERPSNGGNTVVLEHPKKGKPFLEPRNQMINSGQVKILRKYRKKDQARNS
jgi:hypothetical protein